MNINFYITEHVEPLIIYKGRPATYDNIRKNIINDILENGKVIINLTNDEGNTLSIHITRITDRILNISFVLLIEQFTDIMIYTKDLPKLLDKIIKMYNQYKGDVETLVRFTRMIINTIMLSEFPKHEIKIRNINSDKGKLYRILYLIEDYKNGNIHTLLVKHKGSSEVITQVVLNENEKIPDKIKRELLGKSSEKYKNITTIRELLEYLEK